MSHRSLLATRHSLVGIALACASPALAQTQVLVSQQPATNGGVSRWSQLWQDPGPNGNDLDSDAVCWQDFVLSAPASIDHMEWWGTGACELGFQIEVWRQDPGTFAYQPLGVFYYGGVKTVKPEAKFTTTAYTTTPGPGTLLHHSLDLATPISLPANDASNPRWFIGIIGLTEVPFATWNWSQGLGGSNKSYQFIRGDNIQFHSLPEGRALLLSQSVPCFADCDASGTLAIDDFICFQTLFALGDPAADCDERGGLSIDDFICFQTLFAIGC